MPKLLPDSISNSVNELLPFAKIRLVVADLDGTIMGPDECIWGTIQHLERCINYYDVKLTIATGRTLTGVHGLLKNLNLPREIPVILYNGSVALANGSFRTILKKNIPIDNFKQVLEIARIESVRILAYFYEEFFSNNKTSLYNNAYPEFVMGWADEKLPDYDFNGMHIRWMNNNDFTLDSAPSAIIIESLIDMKPIYSILEKVNKISDISATQSGKMSLEIRPKGSNKGIAMKELSKLLHYKREEILALGDHDNDAELLSWAGLGVAVEGASNRALANSNFKSKYNATRGAIQVLRLVREARRYFYNRKTKILKKEL